MKTCATKTCETARGGWKRHDPDPVRLTQPRRGDYGKEQLGSRYLRVRFEELCADPVETAGKVFAFFDLDADPRLAESMVTSQASSRPSVN